MSTRTSVKRALLVMLLAGCGATIAVASLSAAQRSAAVIPKNYVTPTTVQPATLPVAVFLGDSFTEGSQVTEAERYVSLVGAKMGWRAINQGQGGTGYVTDGPAEFPERAPFTDRVQQLVAMHPDVVVVAGGINDSDKGYSDKRISDAVRRTLAGIQAGLPKAQIIVIGPYWPNGFPTKSATTVDRIVAGQADHLGLKFIDPMREHWVTGSVDGLVAGNYATMTGPDHTHPTVAGQLNIASRMTADFARLDVR